VYAGKSARNGSGERKAKGAKTGATRRAAAAGAGRVKGGESDAIASLREEGASASKLVRGNRFAAEVQTTRSRGVKKEKDASASARIRVT